VTNANYVIRDLNVWRWLTLVVDIMVIFAGLGSFKEKPMGGLGRHHLRLAQRDYADAGDSRVPRSGRSPGLRPTSSRSTDRSPTASAWTTRRTIHPLGVMSADRGPPSVVT
jgi:hypothetical protein